MSLPLKARKGLAVVAVVPVVPAVSSTCGMFPRSVFLHFPAEFHRSIGPSQLIPQLLRVLHSDSVSAIQFLRSCYFLVQRQDPSEGPAPVCEISVPVTASDVRIRSVYVRDLPFEVSDADVQSALKSFGVVHSVRPQFFRDFPSVANGTRVLLMSFDESVQSIPSSLSVSNFPVRIWHPGQPVICPICHEPGHLPQACPFSGRCLRCKQPGHRARDCKQAWGPSAAPVTSPVSVSSSPSVTPVSSAPSFSFSAPVSLPVPVSSTPQASVSTPALPSARVPVLSPVSAPVSSPAPVPVSSPPPPPIQDQMEEGEISSESPPSPVSCPVSDRQLLTQRILSSVKPGSTLAEVKVLTAKILREKVFDLSCSEVSEIITSICNV